MPEAVVYDGPTQAEDLSTVFYVDDGEGETHRFDRGIGVEVPSALAKDLLDDGSERFEGHKFSKASKAQAAAGKAADEGDADTGGAGGAGPANTGTATAAATT